jgi:hypothetical protein
MAALAPTERIALRRAARALAESSLQESDAVARMRAMLNGALGRAPPVSNNDKARKGL